MHQYKTESSGVSGVHFNLEKGRSKMLHDD